MAPRSASAVAPLVLAILFLSFLSISESAPCAASRANECDFHFFATRGVPTFILKRTGDTPYGLPIADKANYVVKTLNTNGSCVMGENKRCFDQFYFQQNRVASRTFQVQDPVGNYTNTCVRLTIASVEFNNTATGPHNLNPNDNNAAYPPSRRCIYFSTAPTSVA